MSSTRIRAAVVVLALAGGLLVGTAPAQAVVGGGSAGDSLFPRIGNTGYQVRHYGIRLRYLDGGRIRAVTRIRARAPKPLTRFSLDLQGLHVRSVRVDGRRAAWSRHDHKLVVRPARTVSGAFTTVVRYGGKPVTHIDPDGAQDGWIPTKDGGATVLSEPVGSMTWFPNNNTPRDKASYTVRVNAPHRFKVAGNGRLVSRRVHGSRTTWRWDQRAPMASYLAMISIGRYRMYHSTMTTTTGRRLPIWNFIGTELGPMKRARALVPTIVRFHERRFGPYPFGSVGIVVKKLDVGYALETQTRPVFDGGTDTLTEVHELAHQWYGDSATLGDWQDIWLHEGFATYAEDMWTSAHSKATTASLFRGRYDHTPPSSDLWSPPPARFHDPADLFGAPVYERGGMTLEVLRERIGSTDFLRVLRGWARAHRHGTVRTGQFTAYAERVSGADLGPLFRDWLFTAGKPTGY